MRDPAPGYGPWDRLDRLRAQVSLLELASDATGEDDVVLEALSKAESELRLEETARMGQLNGTIPWVEPPPPPYVAPPVYNPYWPKSGDYYAADRLGLVVHGPRFDGVNLPVKDDGDQQYFTIRRGSKPLGRVYGKFLPRPGDNCPTEEAFVVIRVERHVTKKRAARVA